MRVTIEFEPGVQSVLPLDMLIDQAVIRGLIVSLEPEPGHGETNILQQISDLLNQRDAQTGARIPHRIDAELLPNGTLLLKIGETTFTPFNQR